MTNYRLDWDQSMGISHDEMDDHHQELFRIANRIFEAMENDSDNQTILPIFDELRKNLSEHAQEEEAIMEKYNYPDARAHHVQHRKMKEKLGKTAKALGGDPKAISLTAQAFHDEICLDIVSHIRNTDMLLARFLNEEV